MNTETAAEHHARLRAEVHAEVAAGRHTPTRGQAAYHEAGHAVAALLVGIPVVAVAIPDAGRPGRCEHGAGMIAAPIGAATMLWAGAIAADTLLGATSDLEKIRALDPSWLHATGRDTPFELARGVLAEQWESVEAVAAGLLARDRLNRAELAAMVGR